MQASGQSTFESCAILFSCCTNWNKNSRACPERELWVELRRCSVMWMRVSGAAAYCPHGWLGLAWLCKPDGALSSVSMSPTQIATFIHSSHTITPQRHKASRSINRGKFVFFFPAALQSNKTPTGMKTTGEWLQYDAFLNLFYSRMCS